MNTEGLTPDEVNTAPTPQLLDLESAVKPEDLMSLPVECSPYEFEQMFNLDGFFNKRLAKSKLKQLQVLDSVIRGMLQEGERVLYLTDGIKQSSLEQLFIGWIMYYYNHNAFVFTSERILLIHLTGKQKLGKFVSVINYADLICVKSSFTGSLSLKFRNKKSVVFARIAGKDRKFLKEFLNPLIADNVDLIDKRAPSITNLCPACYEPVHLKSAPSCNHCQLEYKTPKQAALRSLLMPVLGDIYLGSKLGVLELLFMLFLWFSMIVGNLELINEGEEPMAVWIGTFVFLGAIHVIDAIKTHYTATKGVFPQESITKIRG